MNTILPTTIAAILILPTSHLAAADGPAPRVIEFERHVLEFAPSRPDLTVGIALFSVISPDKDWTVKLAKAEKDNFDDRGAFKYLELKQIGKNRFELPALKIQAAKKKSGPVCMTVKVWFNELPNRNDSPFYVNTPDRYSLLTFCTRDDPRARARASQNRVETLKEFREGLKKPFALKMRQDLVPWRPGIIVDNEGGVYFHSLRVGRHREGARSSHRSEIWKLDPDGTLEKVPVPDLRLWRKWPDRVRNLAEDRFGTLVTIAFTDPVAWDKKGNLYVASYTREKPNSPFLYQVARIDSNGNRHAIAGSIAGHKDGAAGEAQFAKITALTVGPAGEIYVADGDLNTGSWIRRVALDGTVTTLAGADKVGFADGKGEAARFFLPSGLAADKSGNLYVADPVNSRIRKVTPDGVVTTVAGGSAGKPKGAESFVQPSGVAVGPSGDLYVLDGGQKMARVRKISQDGKVETLVVVDSKTGREGRASEQRP